MSVSSYLILRLFLGFLDFCTDLFRCGSLLLSDNTDLAFWTLTFPILSVVLSAIYVVIVKRGDISSFKTLSVLILTVHSSIFEPFFQSGPQIVLFLSGLLRGVHVQQYQDLFLRGIRPIQTSLDLLSLYISVLSYLVTAIHYDEETPRTGFCRFMSFFTTTFWSLSYRVFIMAVLFTLRPYFTALLIVPTAYFVNLAVYQYSGSSWESLIYSFSSLFTPSGFSRNLAVSKNTLYSPSEVQRARIAQEALVFRVRLCLALFHGTSTVLFFAYVVVFESFTDHGSILVSWIAQNRIFIYVFPLSLLLMSVIHSWFYHARILMLREATRRWEAITPVRPSIDSSKRRLRETDRELSPVSSIQEIPPPPFPLPTFVNINKSIKVVPGNRRCDLKNECVTCEFMIEGSVFRSMMTGKEYRFMTPVTCTSSNVIYLVTCNKCRKQYVGKTEQQLKQRHYGHRREIETQISPLGKHFAGSCGYASWRFQIIDMCSAPEDLSRREGYWQKELVTLVPWGLNQRVEKS